MTGACSQVIRRLERAYFDRDGCRLTSDEVVNLCLVHEIADAKGVAADLDADEDDSLEWGGVMPPAGGQTTAGGAGPECRQAERPGQVPVGDPETIA